MQNITFNTSEALTRDDAGKCMAIQAYANLILKPGDKLTDVQGIVYILGTICPIEVFVFNIEGWTYVRTQSQLYFKNNKIPPGYFHKPLGMGTNLNILKSDKRDEQTVREWLGL
jgi:hypothetical protein